jgi:hypothetical protein
MTALKATPAAQNLLAEPAPQTGQPGPVTLVIGSDFAGVTGPAATPRPRSRPGRHREHRYRHQPGRGAEPQRRGQHLLRPARGEPGSWRPLSHCSLAAPRSLAAPAVPADPQTAAPRASAV